MVKNSKIIVAGGSGFIGANLISELIKNDNQVISISKSENNLKRKVKNAKYDKIFVDLNDDQFCINLAAKNMKGLKRILKPGGVITAQVGCLSKKPKQIKNWMELLESNFGNAELSEVFIPSFDCRWNFASSSNKDHS